MPFFFVLFFVSLCVCDCVLRQEKRLWAEAQRMQPNLKKISQILDFRFSLLFKNFFKVFFQMSEKNMFFIYKYRNLSINRLWYSKGWNNVNGA